MYVYVAHLIFGFQGGGSVVVLRMVAFQQARAPRVKVPYYYMREDLPDARSQHGAGPAAGLKVSCILVGIHHLGLS